MTAADRLPSTGTPTELDPQPWRHVVLGMECRHTSNPQEWANVFFLPRPEYIQDLAAYEGEK